MAPKRESPNFRHVIIPDDKEMKAPLGFNFNTLIGAIALAVIMWVGKKTSDNSESLTVMSTQLPYVNESVKELKTQIGQLVTRAELASLKADVDAKQNVLDKRVMLLEFEKKKPATEPCEDEGC